MDAISLLFAVFYAIIMTSLLVTLFGSVRNWRSSWPLFVIILFGVLAAAIWITPVGPAIWGYYWLPGLLVAVIFALLLAAALPGRKSGKEKKEENRESEKKVNHSPGYHRSPAAESPKGVYRGDETIGNVMLGGVLWIVIVVLSLIVMAGFLIDLHR